MSYEIYKINRDDKTRILLIEKVKSLNWNDNKNDVHIAFNFSTTENLSCGDWIEIYNPYDNKTVLYGTITYKNRSDFYFYNYSGYDLGRFLVKNDCTIQFKNETLGQAIEKVCKRFNIPCVIPSDMTQKIKKIYKKESLEAIIKDLYKIAVNNGLEDKYYIDCSQMQVELKEYEVNNDLRGYIANLYSLRSLDYINSFSLTSSIEELKNRVEIYTSTSKDNETGRKVYTKQNDKSIQRYGLLTHIEEIDLKKDKDYRSIADKKLNELNVETESSEFTVNGDYNMHKGVITDITNSQIGIDGNYLIISSEHTVGGTKEKVRINVEKYA